MLKREIVLSVLLALMLIVGQLAPMTIETVIAETASAENARDENARGEKSMAESQMSKTESQADDAMDDAWAPEQPLGSALPDFTALDSSGDEITLGSLAGDQGILLVLSRSADW